MTPTNINQFLLDASTAATCQDFGIGPRYAANFESSTKAFPWCWIINIAIDTQITEGAGQENTYKVTGQILDQCSVDETFSVIMAKMITLFPTFQRFMSYISDNALKVEKFRSVQVFHYYDDNLIGYEFSFDVQIPETITYACV